MATGIRELKKGYQIYFRYKGKRYYENITLKPCPDSLAKVIAFREQVIKSIDAGTFDYHFTFPNSKNAEPFKPKVLLTEKCLRDWLDSQEKYLAASTYKDYNKSIENQLVPEFGQTPVEQITVEIINEWIESLDCSTKRKMNLISPLRSALESVKINTLANFKIKQPKSVKRKTDNIDPFTPEELSLIYSALPDQGKNMAQFIAWSGVRTSEMVALNWDDVDFVRGKVWINKAMTQAAKEAEAPKTAASERWIDLLPPARDALLAQKKHTLINGEEVFQNPRTLERWAGDAPIRKTLWHPACKKAGVRYRYPYQLRHTFATTMLNAGESIRWISLQLGHVSWTFTAKTYTRFMPSEFQNAGAKAVSKYWKDAK